MVVAAELEVVDTEPMVVVVAAELEVLAVWFLPGLPLPQPPPRQRQQQQQQQQQPTIQTLPVGRGQGLL
jgi:hypothetical protein